MSVELLLCLGLVSISDIRFKKIPNSLIVAIFLIGIITRGICNVESIIGAVFVPLILIVLSNKYPIGGGDIKLISVLGFCLGFWSQMMVLLVGMSISLTRTIVSGKKVIVLGPFISFGALFTLIMSEFLVKY